MKRFQVLRTHISPYQSKDFLLREEEMVRSLGGLDYETSPENIVEKTILITNTHTELGKLPRKLLDKTSLIIHPNSGYDNFSHEPSLWQEIPVIIGHSIRAQAVAEYTLSALFEGRVELPQHLSWHSERTWRRRLLKDTDIWVFGYGHIGKIVADTLKTLGVPVTVVDPFVTTCPHPLLRRWQEGDIKRAQVVIACTGLNETSREMFNEEFFAQAKSDLLFINPARGKLVNEDALKGFLLKNSEAFAFLDVFQHEPFGEDWHGFPQVWKTSHIAGVEAALDDRILDFEKNVLSDFLSLEEKLFFAKYERQLLQNKWREGVLI